jgi:hypothetical protein
VPIDFVAVLPPPTCAVPADWALWFLVFEPATVVTDEVAASAGSSTGVPVAAPDGATLTGPT